jgi:release factor H-coupled RctB family protein
LDGPPRDQLTATGPAQAAAEPGRRWNRQSARARLKDRYRADLLVKTELGGFVICEDKELLYEEAPPAYKDIDLVISDMTQAGLIRVVATLRPRITYKFRRSP